VCADPAVICSCPSFHFWYVHFVDTAISLCLWYVIQLFTSASPLGCLFFSDCHNSSLFLSVIIFYWLESDQTVFQLLRYCVLQPVYVIEEIKAYSLLNILTLFQEDIPSPVNSLSLYAAEQLVLGIVKLCFCPTKGQVTWQNYRYPSSGCRNLTINFFQGHIDAPSDQWMQEYIVQCFSGKKYVLPSTQYDMYYHA
jgi:hypothetical protein